MKEYDILMSPRNINFNPDENKEIVQNVITICTTPKGTRALDREFGVDPVIVDRPMRHEQSRVTNEIVSAVKKYEPRARITDISFEFADNTMYPRVKLIVV